LRVALTGPLGILLLCCGPLSVVAEEGLVVRFDAQSDELSVQAAEQPFSEVLQRVAQEAGIEVAINQRVDGSAPVSVSFSGLSLEAGLKTLLEGKSFALDRRGEGKRIAKVWVLSELARTAVRPPAMPEAAQRNATVMPALPAPGLADLPDLTDAQREHIVDSLRQYQTSTGKDPREQLEELRRLVAPESAPLEDVPLEQLPDLLIDMMRGAAPATR
jgi:hypothetical protein